MSPREFLYDYKRNVDRKILELQSTYESTEENILSVENILKDVLYRIGCDGKIHVNSIMRQLEVYIIPADFDEYAPKLKRICDGFLQESDETPTIFTVKGRGLHIDKDRIYMRY